MEVEPLVDALFEVESLVMESLFETLFDNDDDVEVLVLAELSSTVTVPVVVAVSKVLGSK